MTITSIITQSRKYFENNLLFFNVNYDILYQFRYKKSIIFRRS